jgi:hypothetical protein
MSKILVKWEDFINNADCSYEGFKIYESISDFESDLELAKSVLDDGCRDLHIAIDIYTTIESPEQLDHMLEVEEISDEEANVIINLIGETYGLLDPIDSLCAIAEDEGYDDVDEDDLVDSDIEIDEEDM